MKTSLTLAFLPEELVGPLLLLAITVAGLCMIVGLRRLAISIVVGALAFVFAPVWITPLVDLIFELIPPWVLQAALLAIVALLVAPIVVFLLMLLMGGWLRRIVGEALVQRFAISVLFAPYRLLGKLVGWMFGAGGKKTS